ncbi:hypothetical protein FF098_014945 [Parvularcula flava]|uniref:Uncharacterized protein n=1 Tax=Aquisalinus luteolus TaxID=1566827 RepID=A0A8J3A9U1_9PROT|nr:hypothetical protein [Aquisalinus luteolus]NHK29215.1 hypothetical protein [Aquisalinus luteolus]GGH99939.1 hypothetical protein GCM10011355_27060 [Aquisalinus luteolus]
MKIEAEENVTWLPTDWEDEMPPERAARPDDFLVIDGDSFHLRALEIQRGEEDLNGYCNTRVALGEVVTFTKSIDLGTVRCLIAKNGEVLHAPELPDAPDGMQRLCRGGWYYIDTTVVGVAKEMKEHDAIEGDEEWLDIDVFAYQSDIEVALGIENDEAHFRLTGGDSNS